MRLAWIVLLGTVLALLQFRASADADPDAVLVEIGEEEVTVGEFQAYLSLLRPNVDFAALSAQAQQRELDDYLERRLLAMRARELGLDRVPETRRQIEFFTDGILAEALRRRMVAAIDVSQRELRAYYRENQDEFQVPPRLLLEHLIYSQPASARQARTALGKGIAYDELVEERTQDPNLVYSRRGWLTPELLISEIAGPVLALSPGEVTDVVQSRYGHHVLRLADREAGYVRPFEEARQRIVEQLQRQKATAHFAETIAELRRAHGVRLHPEALRAGDDH